MSNRPPLAPNPDSGTEPEDIGDAEASEQQTTSELTVHDALDALAAIVPSARTASLADLLTLEDAQTLRHLARQGLGDNSLRALTSDLAYLEAWCTAATGASLPWPAPETLVLSFIAQHLWDPGQKERDETHGMPVSVRTALEDTGLLRSAGPHAPSTIQRRLASWSSLHRWRGLEGVFSAPSIRNALRFATRASDRPMTRKSAQALTSEMLDLMLETCKGTVFKAPSLADVRDKALLLYGFASGGRRRSEIAALRVEQIEELDPVLKDPSDPNSSYLPARQIHLRRTKTEAAQDDNTVLLIGAPVHALTIWLQAANITEGSVFRSINRWGQVNSRPLSPQAVNDIVKKRAALAGLPSDKISAHGLRAGFLTEAANRDIPLQDAMQQSRHRSLTQASRYYNEAGKTRLRSARLMV